jgi:hypothetical protein
MSSLAPDQLEALIEFLRTVPLFTQLRDDELRVIASLAQRDTTRLGQDVYRQSDDDQTLHIVYSGDVRLIHIDPTGAPNDVGTVGRGKMLGESALLLAEPHDVTALALTDVVTLVFKRETFMPLSEQQPRLWGNLTPSPLVAARLNAPHYGWQAPDEAVVLFTRQHWWGLIRRMFFPLLGLLAVSAFVLIIEESLPQLLGLAVLVGFLILAGILTYTIIDWRNDYWVITNKRIVHVDEIVFIRKRRDETPLPAITQVQFERHGMAAVIFDFGDLEVETFTGTIGMRDIPSPMHIRQEIQDEVEKVRSRERAAGRKGIRDDLEKRIIAQEAVVEVTPLEQDEEPPKRPPITLGVFEYFFPKLVWRQGDVIIWRKHWIVLWRTIGWSTLALLIAFLAFLMWFNRMPPVGTLLEDGAWWIWPLILGGLGAWWWWVFEDWRNDEYILTGNRVIEINRTPFSLNEKRRESPLSDFQSTELKVVGPWQKLFRYGTLIIKLPGAQVEFKDIVDPAGAQTEINKRLSEFNAKKAEKEEQTRRNELTDWFAAYDEIRQRDRVKDASSPAAPAQTIGGDTSNGSP